MTPDLDLAIVNGDVIDNVSLFRDSTSYEQRHLLLQNDGKGKFRDVGPGIRPWIRRKEAESIAVLGRTSTMTAISIF
jgi:hypothetical protein